MRLKRFLSLALTIVLVGCASNSISTNQGLKNHKDMKIAYTSAGQELAKDYNFYFRTLSRDEENYGMKFIANDQVIEEDIDWVHFDNNAAVYQLDKADDFREQASMPNPHYLILNGKKYETDDSDNFYVLNGKLIHFRCLEQKYDPEFDQNTCVDRAIYADDTLIDSMKTNSRRSNSIEFSFRDGNRIYYSKIVAEPHDTFDFDYNQTVSLYYYDAGNGEKKLYSELPAELYAFGLIDGELVLGSFDKPLRIGTKSLGVNAGVIKAIDDKLYYIPEEDMDKKLARGVAEKHYISLIRNEEKIGSVFTDNDWPEIEDGTKRYCSSFLTPLFTPSLCVFGDYYFTKSQVGNHILDSQKQMEDLDEYYINGKQLSFYPYFTTPYEFSCQPPSEGEEVKEVVQGVGFLFDKAQKLYKILIVAQEGCNVYQEQKLYAADFTPEGEIANPQLLVKYDGEIFGYTSK